MNKDLIDQLNAIHDALRERESLTYHEVSAAIGAKQAAVDLAAADAARTPKADAPKTE